MITPIHQPAPKPAKKAKTPKETKPVTYKDLRSLKIAKSRKALPRGLKVYHDVGDPEIVFKVPGQEQAVLKVDAHGFIGDSLRAVGFKLA